MTDKCLRFKILIPIYQNINNKKLLVFSYHILKLVSENCNTHYIAIAKTTSSFI